MIDYQTSCFFHSFSYVAQDILNFFNHGKNPVNYTSHKTPFFLPRLRKLSNLSFSKGSCQGGVGLSNLVLFCCSKAELSRVESTRQFSSLFMLIRLAQSQGDLQKSDYVLENTIICHFFHQVTIFKTPGFKTCKNQVTLQQILFLASEVTLCNNPSNAGGLSNTEKGRVKQSQAWDKQAQSHQFLKKALQTQQFFEQQRKPVLIPADVVISSFIFLHPFSHKKLY